MVKKHQKATGHVPMLNSSTGNCTKRVTKKADQTRDIQYVLNEA